MTWRSRRVWVRGAAVAAAAVLALGAVSVPAADAHGGSHPGKPGKPSTKPVSVRLISINDLHGNLEPPSGSSGRVTQADGTTVDAGGAAYLATHVKTLQSQVKNSVLLSGGDSVGATPLISALFHDEPTVAVLNEIGIQASALGNHELDEGYQELLRLQRGGCHPIDGCVFTPRYDGMDFPVLASNVYFKRSGLPALQPFKVIRSGGQSIGVIGATLEDLPDVVVADGIKNLRFGDEVSAINRTSRLLQRLGVKTQVVTIHQGSTPVANTGPNGCNINGGPGLELAKNVSANVDVIFQAHSHQQYNCQIADPAGNLRPVIQGASFGRLLSVVDLKINPRSHDVIRSKTVARNEIVTRTVTPDPSVQAIIDDAKTKSAPLANRQVGRITADMPRSATARSGEIPLGSLIADAQLAATLGSGAQLAITNPGGIRADLTYASSPVGEGDGVVTYGEAFSVQPFANIMQTVTMTGAQLKTVLEQQWRADGTRIVLQISNTLTYTMDETRPIGDRVSELKVGGVPLDPAASYRVSVNNFLAGGGDGFAGFTAATDVTGGPIDLDAFTAYLTANSPVAPPPLGRITKVG